MKIKISENGKSKSVLIIVLYSPIVQVCDAISGARPGARREVAEQYMKRLKDLEALALGYDDVEKTYAIQAGREVRVLVSADKVDDKQSEQLAFDISQKIQIEMTYPGQVKVTVIREVRATAYAKWIIQIYIMHLLGIKT